MILSKRFSKELNIFVDSKIHNRKFTTKWKTAFGAILVGLCIYASLQLGEVYVFFKIATVLIYIVVLNNLIAYWAQKHKKLSPGKFLREKLRFPKTLAYLVLIATYFLLACVFTGYVLL